MKERKKEGRKERVGRRLAPLDRVSCVFVCLFVRSWIISSSSAVSALLFA